MVLSILTASGYGLVVAFTTMPVMSVIAVLLGTNRAENGAWMTLGYATGLAIVFCLAALGATQIPRLGWRPDGLVIFCAGIMLIGAAVAYRFWSYRHNGDTPSESNGKFSSWFGTLGPVSCLFVGLQFAFHPENLVLTIAAASTTAELGLLGGIVTLFWFCAVGVSTVAVPSLLYARSGARARSTAGCSKVASPSRSSDYDDTAHGVRSALRDNWGTSDR